MRILIVEDETKTADYIHKGLTQTGFVVDVARDGEEGLFLGLHHSYDVVILDIMLPKRDGFSIAKELRAAKPNLRILLLTARGELEDRVKGLELGADDYLVKPFAFSELLARVRSLLRRSDTNTLNHLSVADLKVDLLKHKVTRGTNTINLTAKELTLLTFLMQRTGEVLSRTLITESVWDIHFDSNTNVVDVAIKRLRHKIDDGYDTKLIHTVRGMGYVLEERQLQKQQVN